MYKKNLSVCTLVLASFILFFPSQVYAYLCEYNEKVIAQMDAKSFLGGIPPQVLGAFTHESKKLIKYAKRETHLWNIDGYYKRLFRDIPFREQKIWSEREKQPYQIYITFRRSSFDKGDNSTLYIECKQAKYLIFDNPSLRQVQIFGDMVNGIGANEPLRIGVKYTYKVEFKRKNESTYTDNTTALWGPKMRVKHPDNPKKQVIEAIHTLDGMEPGDYEFKVSSFAEMTCEASSAVGVALNLYCSPLNLWDRFIPGSLLKKLPGVSWGIKKAKEWAKNEALSLVAYDQYNAATVATIPVKVTVPKKGVLGAHKDDAVKKLKRYYLKIGETKHSHTDDATKHMLVADTEPGPKKDVPRGTEVNLIIKYQQDYLNNYLKFLKKGKGK